MNAQIPTTTEDYSLTDILNAIDSDTALISTAETLAADFAANFSADELSDIYDVVDVFREALRQADTKAMSYALMNAIVENEEFQQKLESNAQLIGRLMTSETATISETTRDLFNTSLSAWQTARTGINGGYYTGAESYNLHLSRTTGSYDLQSLEVSSDSFSHFRSQFSDFKSSAEGKWHGNFGVDGQLALSIIGAATAGVSLGFSGYSLHKAVESGDQTAIASASLSVVGSSISLIQSGVQVGLRVAAYFAKGSADFLRAAAEAVGTASLAANAAKAGTSAFAAIGVGFAVVATAVSAVTFALSTAQRLENFDDQDQIDQNFAIANTVIDSAQLVLGILATVITAAAGATGVGLIVGAVIGLINALIDAAQAIAEAVEKLIPRITYGTEGNDHLVGRDGADIIYGYGGDDVILAGGGNDEVFAGSGDDLINPGLGRDYVNGDSDTDTVTYQSDVQTEWGVKAEYVIGREIDGWGDFQTGLFIDLKSEHTYLLNQWAGGDNGGTAANVIDSVGTNANGDDLRVNLLYEHSAGIISNFTWQDGATASPLAGGWGILLKDDLNSIENAIGTNRTDVIRGDDGANSIDGKNGDDYLFGGGGNDVLSGGLGTDTIWGGDGFDTVNYSPSINGETIYNTLVGYRNTTTHDQSELTWSYAPNKGAGNTHGTHEALQSWQARTVFDIFENHATVNTVLGHSDDNPNLHTYDALQSSNAGYDATAFHANVYNYWASRDGDWVQSSIIDQSSIKWNAWNYITQFSLHEETLYSIERYIGTTGQDIFNGSSNGEQITAAWGYGDAVYGNGGDDVISSGFGLEKHIDGGADIDTFYFALDPFVAAKANSWTAQDELASSSRPYLFYVNLATNSASFDIHQSEYDTEIDIYNVENVIGTVWRDQIIGDDGNNYLAGYGGDDVIRGGGGMDIIYGGDGDDKLYGDDGNDFFYYDVSNFDDWQLRGDHNEFHGGDGMDTVDYSGDTFNSLTIDLQGNYGWDSAWNDKYYSIENIVGVKNHDNSFYGNESSNSFTGGSAKDIFHGRDGNDVFITGAKATSTDEFFGGADNDLIDFTAFTGGGITLDLSDLSTRSANISGTSIDSIESIIGTDYADHLAGTDEANVLQGGHGADHLIGGGGDDFFSGGNSHDTIEGGDGSDTISYWQDAHDRDGHADNGWDIDLARGTTLTRTGSILADTLSSIEHVIGSDVADAITGDGGSNVLQGQGGVDTINGGNGSDIISGGHDDDYLDGGAGIDTVDYWVDADDRQGHQGTGFDINLATGRSLVRGQNLGVDHLSNFENVVGTDQGDLITGDAGANALDGRGGDDTINGGAGSDILIGGRGNNTLDGGENSDTVSYEFLDTIDGSIDAVGVKINLGSSEYSGVLSATFSGIAAGTAVAERYVAQDFGPSLHVVYASDSLSNIENVVGTNSRDIILGHETIGGTFTLKGGHDDIHVGTGVDTIDTGTGQNVVYLGVRNDTADRLILTATATGSDSINGWESSDIVTVRLAHDDMITGTVAHQNSTQFNTLSGYSFSLRHDGVETPATLADINIEVNGSLDDETNDYSASGLGPLRYNAYDGDDTVTGTLNNDQIFGGDGEDTLNGSGGSDVLFGGDGDDDLTGGDGGDVFSGGRGADTITGGQGIDIIDYSLDIDEAETSQIINVTSGTGATGYGGTVRKIDGGTRETGVFTSTFEFDTFSGIEAITGSHSFDFFYVGSDMSDVTVALDGNEGYDQLSLVDYNVADNHRLIFNLAGETFSYVMEGSADTETETVWLSGIKNIERVVGSQESDIFIDSALVDNEYVGGGGDDVFFLSGGADEVDGGDNGTAGDLAGFHDFIQSVTVNLSTGIFSFAVQDGTKSGSLTNIEHVVGTEFNDTITGDSNANMLDGAQGNDQIWAGEGSDTIIFARGFDDDVVHDFNIAEDTIRFDLAGAHSDLNSTGITTEAIGSDVKITVADHGSVTLKNKALTDLDTIQFEFL
ncbi:hypothetical protein [uncultured Ruegeria sp.]|uniref:beta strand repeat-containing protein n=1 Tax=uncultured Ruegeria sp. TaxID=259304 RepID=UPI00261D2D76|nr:hypothetical protein [uncultured Ruegeria sp.]